jgi:hypothetical protein
VRIVRSSSCPPSPRTRNDNLTVRQRALAIAASASRIAGVTIGVISFTAVGLAFADAVLAGTGDSSRLPHNLRISPAPGGSLDELYPGGRADLRVEVTNPNAYPVTVTDIVSSGAVRSDRGSACTRTGVAFGDRHGLRLRIAGHSAQTVTLARAVSMSTASENGCEGARFTIPLALRATR